MILHGNQRGGYGDLATHLMKPENEKVVVHDLRGFVADDLQGAFRESYAISKGTRCKQHLFSLSLNPPKHADVSPQAFEQAIGKAEERLGLSGQPRAIVFHDKRGEDGELRRHAHAVWCRIDSDVMKAVHLPHTHKTLRTVSRELYVSHGWRMPDGLRDARNRDVRNMTLAEWQQAKRAGHNPKEIKALFQDCWAVSDGRVAFGSALAEKGYVLAQGKRGHVAVDHQGEVYPVSRWVGLKAKETRERLGTHDDLPGVQQAQSKAASIIAERLKQLKDQEVQAAQSKEQEAADERKRLEVKQTREAARLRDDQVKRQAEEQAQRNARLRKGIVGLLDRITGKRKRTLRESAAEAALQTLRDRRETEAVQYRQHQEQIRQVDRAKAEQGPHRQAVRELQTDIGWLRALPDQKPEPEKHSTRRRQSKRSRDGPTPER